MSEMEQVYMCLQYLRENEGILGAAIGLHDAHYSADWLVSPFAASFWGIASATATPRTTATSRTPSLAVGKRRLRIGGVHGRLLRLGTPAD